MAIYANASLDPTFTVLIHHYLVCLRPNPWIHSFSHCLTISPPRSSLFSQGRHGVRLGERSSALRSHTRTLLDERQLLQGGAQGRWQRRPLRSAQRKALI